MFTEFNIILFNQYLCKVCVCKHIVMFTFVLLDHTGLFVCFKLEQKTTGPHTLSTLHQGLGSCYKIINWYLFIRGTEEKSSVNYIPTGRMNEVVNFYLNETHKELIHKFNHKLQWRWTFHFLVTSPLSSFVSTFVVRVPPSNETFSQQVHVINDCVNVNQSKHVTAHVEQPAGRRFLYFRKFFLKLLKFLFRVWHILVHKPSNTDLLHFWWFFAPWHVLQDQLTIFHVQF